MLTGVPSKRISPLSIGWIPAMHLMSVDLPAPLSPTRAMTSPGETWKSTSNSAWTAPKLFETPCSSRTGVSVTSKSPLGLSGPGASGRGAPEPILYCRPISLHFAARSPAQISSTLGKSTSPV